MMKTLPKGAAAGFGGVQTAQGAAQLGETIKKLRKADPARGVKPLSWEEIADRPDVWAQVAALVGGAYGAGGGRSVAVSLGLSGYQTALLISAFEQVENDPTLRTEEEKTQAKLALLSQILTTTALAADQGYEAANQRPEALPGEISLRAAPPGQQAAKPAVPSGGLVDAAQSQQPSIAPSVKPQPARGPGTAAIAPEVAALVPAGIGSVQPASSTTTSEAVSMGLEAARPSGAGRGGPAGSAAEPSAHTAGLVEPTASGPSIVGPAVESGIETPVHTAATEPEVPAPVPAERVREPGAAGANATVLQAAVTATETAPLTRIPHRRLRSQSWSQRKCQRSNRPRRRKRLRRSVIAGHRRSRRCRGGFPGRNEGAPKRNRHESCGDGQASGRGQQRRDR